MRISAAQVFWRVLGILLLVAIVTAIAFGYLFRQQISDHIAAFRFEPTRQVLELTERLQFTDEGRRIFLASQPTLEASQYFNEQCSQVDHSEDGNILGCYTAGHIHLYEVTDERLNGIIEVTAAHEQMHAAYQRLSEGDRKALATRLTELYDELKLEDSNLADRMSVYSALSPAAFGNELHSVLGTEVRELPEWLEDHYAAWYQDRGVILDFFDSYHAIFDELKARADQLQDEMEELRTAIERRSDEYDAAVARFNDEAEEFSRRNQNFEFSSNPAEFYRIRDDLESRRQALHQEMSELNADIERYEQMRQELIELSDLNHELEQQLDSELAPPSSAPAPVS